MCQKQKTAYCVCFLVLGAALGITISFMMQPIENQECADILAEFQKDLPLRVLADAAS